jgi:hypothetical protein
MKRFAVLVFVGAIAGNFALTALLKASRCPA